MAKAKARFGQLWKIWSSTAFPTTTKIRLFGAVVVSVLVYGMAVKPGCWTVHLRA